MSEQKILVNIDTLFDTRLACVFLVDPNWVEPLLQRGYHERRTNKLSDLYSAIDDKAINELWKQRSIGVLSSSFVTEVPELIASRIAETAYLDPEHPQYAKYDVTINLFPYELNVKDITDLTSTFCKQWSTASVRTISKPLKEITPTFLSKNYTQFITDDLNEWTGYHMDALAHMPIPHVSCIVPAVLLPDKPCKEKMEDVTRAIKMIYGAHLDLEIVPISTMSVSLKNNSK